MKEDSVLMVAYCRLDAEGRGSQNVMLVPGVRLKCYPFVFLV